MLNENSNEEDRTNFLKEAKLMSKLNHEHIIKMYGLCMDYNQPIILLELMEGGDLLGYLRKNRPTETTPSPLTMLDLLSICTDIAKGCQYLESIQFVHRDLAARNCLVSSWDASQRVIKIADFGLTRGVYSKSYYRKDGGMLPVKWMAPECLIDGVFTCKGDVSYY